MKKFLLLMFFALCLSATGAYSQSYKVVVNSSNEVSSLTTKEVSDLLLKKKTKWSNGKAVMPVDLSANSKVRDSFSQAVHGKTTAAVRSFWQQAAFSGAGTAPVEKSSDADVLDFVQKNPGAIGYVSSGANTANVKTLTIN